MFFAAFTSRSWLVPQARQVHSLIRKPALPFGLSQRELQHEHVWVVYASLTSSNYTPALSHLYLSMVRNAVQLASITDFASLVFAKPFAFTLPTKMAAWSLTN